MAPTTVVVVVEYLWEEDGWGLREMVVGRIVSVVPGVDVWMIHFLAVQAGDTVVAWKHTHR